jgi:hypothetical protein
VNLAPAILDQYIGEYEVDQKNHVKVIRENDKLVALAPDNYKMTVYAESEKDFYIIGQYLLVHFVKDKAGKVICFQMERYEGESFVKKIE